MKALKITLVSIFLICLTEKTMAQTESQQQEKCKTIIVCPDTIVSLTLYQTLQKELDSLKMPVEIIDEQIVVVPDIDKFLNVRDTTIFGSQFQTFAMQEVHPRSRDYYLLIKGIHDLSELLTDIGSRSISQLSHTKTDIEKARQQIETVNSFIEPDKRKVTDFLSEQQKQYYRSLVSHYNELYEQIYLNHE